LFEWGKWDCFAYVVDAAGVDVSHLPARKYRTQTGAMLYLKRNGFESLEALMDSLAESVPVGFAQKGDILMQQGCLGICKGGTGLFLAENSGYERLNTFASERAWRVIR
jgi:hypothetical protein